MAEPCIHVEKLVKSFGSRRVVDDLSFSVKKGEVFALLGHNGAGKSTTIDLILGLKAPESGSAKILGMDAAKNRKRVFERVGVQLQNTQYQQGITVEEACIEYASLYSAPADYPQLLDGFGLGDLRKSFVSKLSGGERQKLSVVLALIGSPDRVSGRADHRAGCGSTAGGVANAEAAEASGPDHLSDYPLYGGSGSPLRQGVYHKIREKGCGRHHRGSCRRLRPEHSGGSVSVLYG